MEPDATGIASGLEEFEGDGFQQPTAMLDKAELLGELAELNEGVPDTRAAIEAEAPPKGFRLIIVAGPDIGLEWSFKVPEITIGRGTENPVDFSDIAVSRQHARISQNGGFFYLADLGSNNGTLLNGDKIEKTEQLSSGDEVVVGARTLRFVELDEAPSTAAAHPVGAPAAEPIVGSPSEIAQALQDGGEEPGAHASEVDVGVVPDADGPAEGEGGAAKGEGEEEEEKPRSALRPVLVTLFVLAAIGGLVFAGVSTYRNIMGRKEAARLLMAKREFLQGIELVKTMRFPDALMLFEHVLHIRPEYMRAKEYKAHCEREIQNGKLLEAAKKLADQGKPEEAIAWIKDLDPDSAYWPEAERLRKLWARALAEKRLAEARARYASGDADSAMDLVMSALREDGSLSGAQDLRDQIDDMRRPQDPKEPKPRSRIPVELLGAVELYRADRIPAAIDAAEAAGGPRAPMFVERMKKVKAMLAEAEIEHRAKAAADLLQFGPAALDLDRQIAEGTGKPRDRIRALYADGLYLKGLEASVDHDLGKAFSLWSEAAKIAPDHQLVHQRLEELDRQARQLYYDGFAAKDSNPEETKKAFRLILQMSKADNPFHQKAAKWLAGHGG
jgi:tetratricopeptide (TPR) repeat protein